MSQPIRQIGRLPDEATIRAEWAVTPRAVTLADRWGVSASYVYATVKRLGLVQGDGRRRRASATPVAAPAPERAPSNVVQFEAPVLAVAEEPPTSRVVLKASRVPAPECEPLAFRLGLDDLVLVHGLACRLGIAPEETLAVVRADAAARRPGIYQ